LTFVFQDVYCLYNKEIDMRTKLQVGSKIEFEKFDSIYSGTVRNISSQGGNTWYGIKITDKKEVIHNVRSRRLRVSQVEHNYLKNLKKLVVVR
jgi:hypothetical protein